MDFVIRRARVRGLPDLVDIGVNGGRIETVHPHVHMLVDDTDDPNSRSAASNTSRGRPCARASTGA